MRKLWLTRALVLLGTVAVATLAHAQTTSNGPYYATPSWDQTLACATLATCPRFIVLSNMSSAAVLDRETGLVWEQSPSTGTFSWSGDPAFTAAAHCNRLTTGDRLGWQLPTLKELASLVDPTQPGRLPPGHPFSSIVANNAYWSATTVASDTSRAWGVILASPGNVFAFFAPKADGHLVWCVRGGQGVDAE